MTAVVAGQQHHFKQYRVPRTDGSALVDPAAVDLLHLLESRSFPPAEQRLEFCGKAFDVVRRDARSEVVELALAFTSHYQDIDVGLLDAGSIPIILSGHQPELFHPGVWFKNFLLSRLAQQSSGLAINFLVDNDLCRSSAIRVPTLESPGVYAAKSVLFDKPREAVPWELRRLESAQCWHDFPSAVDALLPTGQQTPLLHQLWPHALESVKRNDRIGLAIAESRHRLEKSLGLKTLEVPLSHLVSTRCFARFSIQLLSQLPSFQQAYNSQLTYYRSVHRIRNHAHPVPELVQEHGWLEAPWWIYRAEAPKRQRMWVRVVDNQLLISDRAGWQAVIEGRLDCDNAASQWLDLLAEGICLRPRALLTTMYLRLMVSDLFIHGIGGGKYDQLTDAIVRDFFGIEPPPTAVATSTVCLPLGTLDLEAGSTVHETESSGEPSSPARIEHLRATERQQMWRLEHNADQILSSEPGSIEGNANTSNKFPHNFSSDQLDDSMLAELTTRKQQLLSNIPPRGEKWEWHREITEVNRRLRDLATAKIDASKARLDHLTFQQRQQRIVASREYSFCLYPQQYLAELLRQLADN
jgi:hypothetical protein